MEDLQQYLRDIVRPTVRDFERHPRSVRHAFLACVALFHSVDYLAFPNKARGTRQQFRKDSSEFLMIDRLAHAFKHVGTTGKKGRLLATDVIARPSAKWSQ